ncbi:hypothetical protein I302_106719 [Kwoniella bestiolae CBS 10118]|uniref:Uncharacterized protein n=1 Tax=Kwoniella bestiolae CBS 10118 TaxID=1296100 RepID=A0A1B9G0L8_9TREE|nr:hypothetical protein I302_06017 [Kwoniella bestiolae CBS 10118]OCF24556.1 hypothetical protein I302_06017 [Kwoniella bestiolae CBS 10118]
MSNQPIDIQPSHQNEMNPWKPTKRAADDISIFSFSDERTSNGWLCCLGSRSKTKPKTTQPSQTEKPLPRPYTSPLPSEHGYSNSAFQPYHQR